MLPRPEAAQTDPEKHYPGYQEAQRGFDFRIGEEISFPHEFSSGEQRTPKKQNRKNKGRINDERLHGQACRGDKNTALRLRGTKNEFGYSISFLTRSTTSFG